MLLTREKIMQLRIGETNSLIKTYIYHQKKASLHPFCSPRTLERIRLFYIIIYEKVFPKINRFSINYSKLHL